MVLTKKDLKEIGGVVEGVVEKKLDSFAVMVKKGFDETATKKDFKELKEELTDVKKDVKVIKHSVNNLEFIATEMVRRNEFLELKKEVEILKQKIV